MTAAATATAATTKCITKILATPGKVANTLDWHRTSGSVLSLSISRDEMDLAVASHPSWCEPVQLLESIPLRHDHHRIISHDNSDINGINGINGSKNGRSKRVLSARTVEELAAVVHDWQVVGLVVGWPVRKGGWCGASCGRVLYTLEHMAGIHPLSSASASASSSDKAHRENDLATILDAKQRRPMCLWDVEHHLPAEDRWGRAAVYSIPCDANQSTFDHVASKEQYYDHYTNAGITAVDIWKDFCRAHWPELLTQQHERAGVVEAAAAAVGGEQSRVSSS